MVKARKRRRPKRPTRGRGLALALVAASIAVSAGVLYLVRGGDLPGGTHRPGPEDRDAIDAAQAFVNHWSRFEYGEALLVSTGETRNRVLEAMEKELSLEGQELGMAEMLRAQVASIRLDLVVHSVDELEDGVKLLHATALAREADQLFERDQTFRVEHGDGWKVAEWDTGTQPEDKER